MLNDIISEWLNLLGVKFDRAITNGDSTEIYLNRDYSLGFTCSHCGQMSFWNWDLRKAKSRDLSIFEFKTYLIIHKHCTNCPNCGVKTEKLDFVDSYCGCTTRFEELVGKALLG